MKYLLDEHPVTFHKSLALTIGLNEAIILQYIHFWINSKRKKQEEVWIYKTYNQIQEELPFFSESTIKRAIKKMLDFKILKKENRNKAKIDKTNWYTIDYQKLSEICGIKMTYPVCQNDLSSMSNCNNGEGQNDTTNTIDNPLSTTLNKENTKESENLSTPDEDEQNEIDEHNFKIFWDAYPRKEGRTKAFGYFKQWVRGRRINGKTIKLTDMQIYDAVLAYAKEKKYTETKYIQQGSTFFNTTILDYVDME